MKQSVESDEKKRQSLVKVSSTSMDMFEKRKEMFFKNYFKMMGGEKTTPLTSTSLNITELTSELLEIYTPLLANIENGKTISEDQFIIYSHKLYQVMNND
jgi:hypothetical protein